MPLTKSILVALKFTTVVSAMDAAIQKKIYVLGMTTLTNKERQSQTKK